jgi:hypothetical protein
LLGLGWEEKDCKNWEKKGKKKVQRFSKTEATG